MMDSAGMAHEDIVDYLDGFPSVTSSYPFGPGARVWKVEGKMFALVPDDVEPPSVSLKCDPDLALELRAEFPDNVTGAYHMNKKHWNTVVSDGGVPLYDLEDWIGHSYDLVVASLPKATRMILHDQMNPQPRLSE